MLLSDVLRIYRGWRRAPPTHRLVAGYMGFKPPPAESDASREQAQSFRDLKSMFPDGVIR